MRVNAVGPGYIDTGVYQAALAKGQLDQEAILGRIPMRRLGLADEVAGAVSFLASSAASYITAQTIYVEGGYLNDYGVATTALATRAVIDPIASIEVGDGEARSPGAAAPRARSRSPRASTRASG